jgi:pSer/pThr/pTyr-binding forkhead associated (FHA) protein
MSGDPFVIQLSWEDPTTGEPIQASFQAPIAIGRESSQMPEQLGSQRVTHLELVHKHVSRWHALITIVNRQLYITDKSANGTFLNGRRVPKNGQAFLPKDTLRIGPFKITATISSAGDTVSTELNPENSRVSKVEMGPSPNAVLIWLVGGVILLLIGGGIWLVARVLLNEARPEVDPDSPDSSLRISEVAVKTLETTATT